MIQYMPLPSGSEPSRLLTPGARDAAPIHHYSLVFQKLVITVYDEDTRKKLKRVSLDEWLAFEQDVAGTCATDGNLIAFQYHLSQFLSIRRGDNQACQGDRR